MLAGPSALWGDGLGTVAVLWGEPGGCPNRHTKQPLHFAVFGS